jgi:hypothetical protein
MRARGKVPPALLADWPVVAQGQNLRHYEAEGKKQFNLLQEKPIA